MAVLRSVTDFPMLEPSPYETDDGGLVGRDPRKIPALEWAGTRRLTGMQAIRAKCLDCSYSALEVRKCSCATCPLWPYRMGAVPKGLREAESESAALPNLEGVAS